MSGLIVLPAARLSTCLRAVPRRIPSHFGSASERAIVKAREVDRRSYWRRNHGRHRSHMETVALPRWDKHDPTDLEEFTHWTARIILFGGIAVAIIIGLVILAFCAL